MIVKSLVTHILSSLLALLRELFNFRVTTLFISLFLISVNYVLADTRFRSSYPCSDEGKICVDNKREREYTIGALRDGTIAKDKVSRPCWQWAYTKKCSYPSKDNCKSYAHCYEIAIRKCLLSDSIGNCVNQYKEFSCKRWVPDTNESQKVRTDLKEKEGPESIVCTGIPCLDGNCVDKSYLTNGEMMDSVSKLYAVSEAKGTKDLSSELFSGFAQHCTKKVAGYSNCCAGSIKGWGKGMSAGCTKDEKQLNDLRSKKLCVYVGKQNKGIMKSTVKHHYCCFGNMFNKVIQVQGRKQLGMNFGSSGRPDCRGLKLEEILKLNFEQMDFSEFIDDLKLKFLKNAKLPNIKDMEMRAKGSLSSMKSYDGDSNNKANNASGWSKSNLNEAKD